jgi:outer membrane lipoprotein SlyB
MLKIPLGLELPPSYGIVTGVRYITIQNDTGYNTAGTITGGTPGGLFGHVMKVERQVVIGVAAAGVLAGQAMQRWLARSQFVELFIRPTDGRFCHCAANKRDAFTLDRMSRSSVGVVMGYCSRQQSRPTGSRGETTSVAGGIHRVSPVAAGALPGIQRLVS